MDPLDKKNKVKRLPVANMRLQETDYTCWHVTLPLGVTVDDLVVPTFWAHVARHLKPLSEIRADAIDGSFITRMYVTQVGDTWAKVHVWLNTDMRDASVSDDDPNFYVEFPNATDRWCVRRKTDKSIVKSGFTTREDAATWMQGHVAANATEEAAA
tara:strand:- start:5597 stop:6064 length:468 start_codon:yes stop_codon:yes gene_type:complete